jgi:hypothetical protein
MKYAVKKLTLSFLAYIGDYNETSYAGNWLVGRREIKLC